MGHAQQQLGLHYHVVHGRLPATAASADPVTSATAGKWIPPVTAPGPTQTERKKKVPALAAVWGDVQLFQSRGGGELILREPAAPLMSAWQEVIREQEPQRKLN